MPSQTISDVTLFEAPILSFNCISVTVSSLRIKKDVLYAQSDKSPTLGELDRLLLSELDSLALSEFDKLELGELDKLLDSDRDSEFDRDEKTFNTATALLSVPYAFVASQYISDSLSDSLTIKE